VRLGIAEALCCKEQATPFGMKRGVSSVQFCPCALESSVQDKCCEPTKLGEMITEWNESFCSIHMDMFVAAHYSLVLGNSKHF
jgi:hypothetical protein